MKVIIFILLVALASSNRVQFKGEEDGAVDIIKCLLNDETLIPNIQRVIAAVETGDINTIISTLIEVGPNIYNSIITCLYSSQDGIIDIIKCLLNDSTLITNIQQIIAAIQTGDITTIISTIINVGPNIYNSIITCINQQINGSLQMSISKIIKKIKKLWGKVPSEVRKQLVKIIKKLISHGKKAARNYCLQLAEQKYPLLAPFCELIK